jgi:hypothetical protein
VLDIYAEFDRATVIDSTPERRRAAIAADGDKYTQSPISGARPGFFGLEDSLLGRIRGWLAANTRETAAVTP